MKKATILVVDDEKNVLKIMSYNLRARGYSVITAANGIDGYDLARSKRPDLIILDILIPDIDGSELAEKLKEEPETKDIPVIFQTALLSKDIEKNNRNIVGGNVMFAKPCDFDELAKQIEKLLAISAA